MRYDQRITKRQHTKESYYSMELVLMLIISSKLFDLDDNDEIEVFIMEKPNVSVLDTKTKDGIHMIFGMA